MFAKTLNVSYLDSDFFILLLGTVVGALCVSSAGTQCKGDNNSLFLGVMVAKPEILAPQNKDQTQTLGVTNIHSGMVA